MAEASQKKLKSCQMCNKSFFNYKGSGLMAAPGYSSIRILVPTLLSKTEVLLKGHSTMSCGRARRNALGPKVPVRAGLGEIHFSFWVAIPLSVPHKSAKQRGNTQPHHINGRLRPYAVQTPTAHITMQSILRSKLLFSVF